MSWDNASSGWTLACQKKAGVCGGNVGCTRMIQQVSHSKCTGLHQRIAHLFITASPHLHTAPISSLCGTRYQLTHHTTCCTYCRRTLTHIITHIICTMSIRTLRRLLASSTGCTHTVFSSLPRSSAPDVSVSPLCPEHSLCLPPTARWTQRQHLRLRRGSSATRMSSTLPTCCTPACHSPTISAYSLSYASSSLHPFSTLYVPPTAASNANKTQLSSLVTPHSSRGTLHALGFPLSAASYSTGRLHAEQHHPAALAPPRDRLHATTGRSRTHVDVRLYSTSGTAWVLHRTVKRSLATQS